MLVSPTSYAPLTLSNDRAYKFHPMTAHTIPTSSIIPYSKRPLK